MGRVKSKGKHTRADALAALAASAKPAEPTYTTPELLLKAGGLMASQDFELAKKFCERAVELAAKGKHAKHSTEAFEMLGTVELELGELDEAREAVDTHSPLQHFLASIAHAAGTADPSPAPYLYLAQLSTPEESLAHFSNALLILQAKLGVIERAKLGLDGGAGTGLDVEEEEELRRSASRALVGMTELYLTDLCFEDEAEANCEKNLALAEEIDPTDPEVYQTLASVRLSQERPEDAKVAALKGWSLWRTLEADSENYPPYTTRLAYAQRLIEVSLYSSALEILQRLENEDDEDPEIWYMSGWAWWLLGEERGEQESTGEEESRDECWSEGRLCLENFLRLHSRAPEETDPEQLAHVEELMGNFDAAGVIASTGAAEGAEEWSDESDAEGQEDVEME